MKYDYIVVGQGLAGTVVCFELLEHDKKILLLDNGVPNSASRVAAGLFNPFTGPRMAFSWQASTLFPFLFQYYKALEEKMQEKFFFPQGIYRPFQSIEEQNDFIGKSATEEYRPFIGPVSNTGIHSGVVDDRFGGVTFHQAGFLDVQKFLMASLNYFQSRLDYQQEHFDHDQLEIHANEIRYGNHRSAKIIFCTGFMAGFQPLFSWLPLVPLKGEILWIKPEKEFQTIYSKGCFIIPRNNGECMAGATYDRKDQGLETTVAARSEITSKLDSLLNIRYEVTGQTAGIRPATVNRRPLLGVHPKYPMVAVFNGLGTKGVTLAPFFGNQLINYLEAGGKLDQAVDINRYNSLYYTSIFEAKG